MLSSQRSPPKPSFPRAPRSTSPALRPSARLYMGRERAASAAKDSFGVFSPGPAHYDTLAATSMGAQSGDPKSGVRAASFAPHLRIVSLEDKAREMGWPQPATRKLDQQRLRQRLVAMAEAASSSAAGASNASANGGSDANAQTQTRPSEQEHESGTTAGKSAPTPARQAASLASTSASAPQPAPAPAASSADDAELMLEPPTSTV